MSSLKDKEILVIYDSLEIRLVVRKILEGVGAHVIECESAEQGLVLAKSKSPQLILLDLVLPQNDGYDFLLTQKNAKELCGIPTIVLSGKKDKASVVKAITLGASDYILKPFRATSILQKIRKTLCLTSFMTYDFPKDDRPVVFGTLPATIIEACEGGCHIDSNVRLGPNENVKIIGELVEQMEVQDLPMKSTLQKMKQRYISQNQYISEVCFLGMDEQKAKKIRNYLRTFS